MLLSLFPIIGCCLFLDRVVCEAGRRGNHYSIFRNYL